jgi:hypothetical protein
MPSPNFFIVGAPKSGTTSLYHYLTQHPDIYIPSSKEPRFFINDHILNTNETDPIKEYLLRTSSLEESAYLDLYANRNEKVLADASTQYLFHHQEVIPKVKKMVGDPKILILLRNPTDRAYSNFLHNSLTYEDLSFVESIEAEQKRKEDKYNSFWFYKGLSTYFEPVKAYQAAFSQVKVVLFEDFVKDTKKTMKEIYSFLEIDNEFAISEYLVNKKNTGTPRSKTVNSLLNKGQKLNRLKKMVSLIIGKDKLKLIRELLMRSNLSKKNNRLSEDLRKEVDAQFYADVQSLKKILPDSNINWLK